MAMYLEDIFTVPVNLAGVPAISIPSGFKDIDGKKMPIGLQFISDNSREDILFEISKKLLGEK